MNSVSTIRERVSLICQSYWGFPTHVYDCQKSHKIQSIFSANVGPWNPCFSFQVFHFFFPLLFMKCDMGREKENEKHNYQGLAVDLMWLCVIGPSLCECFLVCCSNTKRNCEWLPAQMLNTHSFSLVWWVFHFFFLRTVFHEHESD